jgi:hypothetical protein
MRAADYFRRKSEGQARRVLAAVPSAPAASQTTPEVAALLAKLADVDERIARGIEFLDAGGSRGPGVQRRFEQLIDQAADLQERINAIAPGAADDLMRTILDRDEAQARC